MKNLLGLQLFFLFEPVPLIYMIKKMVRSVDLIMVLKKRHASLFLFPSNKKK
jgi:hypothetical protein